MSAAVTNPIFSANTFYLPLSSNGMMQAGNPRIQFACFVVTNRTQGNAAELENKGQARLLGECVLEMGSLLP